LPPRRRTRKADAKPEQAELELDAPGDAGDNGDRRSGRGGRSTTRSSRRSSGRAPARSGGGRRGSDDGGDAGEVAESTIQEQPLSSYLEQAYKRYAIDTILDRALPDVCDGLKPVQRRILYTMHEMRLRHDGPTRKSARVVGDCMGKYHPHGDSSVYDAMVRMAQDFSMLHPLVDGQGNFGSADGDSAAAMRYTEARLSAIGEMMLADLDKDTVDWKDNFDGSEREPMVLPARFPNLLVNGSAGIAVGMATSLLPHNLGEICDAVTYLAKRWDKRQRVTAKDLMKYVPGPDLPTGGVLYRYRMQGDRSVDMILEGYEGGNTTLVCQGKADIHDIGGGRSEIVVTELPFQVQKNTILERVAADPDKFPGITDVRDESDYQGMRVVFEVSRGADPQRALEALLTYTQMRASLSYNAMALVRVDGVAQPRQLSLRDMLEEFVLHRLDVIVRRTRHELERAEARLHIVEGLLKALDAIDEVIGIIRRSRTTETAQTNLMRKLSITEVQAQAILDMPLKRLAALERRKLADEAEELRARIEELQGILGSESRRLDLVIDETKEIKDRFAVPRRTIIADTEEGHQAALTVADLVTPQEPQRVTVRPDSVERADATVKRHGRRSTSEYVLCEAIVPPEATLYMVTDRGRMWLDAVGRLPERQSVGGLRLQPGERIVACGAVEGSSLVLVTLEGNVKRMERDQLFGNWSAGFNEAVGLQSAEDRVLGAAFVSEKATVLIGTAGNEKQAARALRFAVEAVNPQASPSARGVTAIRAIKGDPLVDVAFAEPGDGAEVVVVTRGGLAKRVVLDEFPVQGRAGKGVQLWKVTGSSGPVAGVELAHEADTVDVLLSDGTSVPVAVKDVARRSRPARGVGLGVDLDGGIEVVGLTRRAGD